MADLVNFVSGRFSYELAEKIAKCYGKKLSNINLRVFADGEIEPSYEETVRGSNLFIIQSINAPADNLFELLLLIDAAKRASARQITAVIPYFSYARQDRKSKPRVSIGAKLIVKLLTATGVDRVITMDLHTDQIQGFFDIPVDHLYASSIFIPYLREQNIPDMTIASPDAGGAKRGAAYAKFLNTDLVICFKQRFEDNKVNKVTLIGEVKGRNVVLVDDIIDTAGTICKVADVMMENGALSVRAVCTHPVLSGHAYDNIENSRITEVIVADTIPLKKKSKKIKVLSTAELFADVISRVNSNESISTHFNLNTIV